MPHGCRVIAGGSVWTGLFPHGACWTVLGSQPFVVDSTYLALLLLLLGHLVVFRLRTHCGYYAFDPTHLTVRNVVPFTTFTPHLIPRYAPGSPIQVVTLPHVPRLLRALLLRFCCNLVILPPRPHTPYGWPPITVLYPPRYVPPPLPRSHLRLYTPPRLPFVGCSFWLLYTLLPVPFINSSTYGYPTLV